MKALPLRDIDPWEPLAARWRVSEVARGVKTPKLRGAMPSDWPRSFMLVYRKAGGRIDRMPKWWQQERERFIARHMAQVKAHNEPIWTKGGSPTRRHLALIFWAYSPQPGALRTVLSRLLL